MPNILPPHVVDMSATAATLAANLLVQSTLVLTVGLAATGLLRRRGAAVQSSVLRATLLAALACPAISWLLAATGVSGLRIELPAVAAADDTMQSSHLAEASAEGNVSPVPADAAGPPLTGPLERRASLPGDALTRASAEQLPPLAAPSPRDESTLVATPTPDRTDAMPPPAVSGGYSAASWVYVAFSAVWLAVMGMLVGRLIVANVLVMRLRRSARPAPPETMRLCASVARALGVRSPKVLVSSKVKSPCLAGCWRPVVLLPAEMASPDRDVLVHELAHLGRRDCWWQLAGRGLAAVLWFQPLAWVLSRRLEQAADEVCDDCVVAQGNDRSAYALRLVNIAERYQPNWSEACVGAGIVSFRSSLGQRVVRILDTSRSLSVKTGLKTLLAILPCAAAAVLLAGLVGTGHANADPSQDEPAQSTVAVDQPDEQPGGTADGQANGRKTNEEAVGGAPETAEQRVPGRVVDAAGKPVAKARVYAIRQTVRNHRARVAIEIAAEIASDEDGRFQLPVSASSARMFGRNHQVEKTSIVVAVADGYGPDWHHLGEGPLPQELGFRLVKDTVPLAGRILDLEGRPIAGVRVRVRSMAAAASGLEEWIAKARNNPARISDDAWTRMDREAGPKVAYFPSSKALTEGLPMYPTAVSDKNGRFQITGLGPDRHVTLELVGPTIATAWVSAVTREMAPVPEPSMDPRIRQQVCYGAKFDYSAEPMQVITGVVRDADTKEPLVGAAMIVLQYAGALLDVSDLQGSPSATTDEKGRYRIVGMPKPPDGARAIRLIVAPPADQPYFRTDVSVPKAAGLEPVELNVDLKRAVWVTGRVTDKATGKGVQSQVSYYPYLDNPAAPKYANFIPGLLSVGWGDDYATGPDGTFRLPAIVGRGVVLAVGLDGGRYQVAAGADEIPWKSDPAAERRLVYHIHGPELANTVRAVEIAADQNEARCDLELVPLDRQVIRLLDPQGRGVKGVKVVGDFPRSAVGQWQSFYHVKPQETDAVEVFGLAMDGRRLILLHHADRQLGRAVVANPATTTAVTLEPFATISGRILDSHGKAVANVERLCDDPCLAISRPQTAAGLGELRPLAGGRQDRRDRSFPHRSRATRREVPRRVGGKDERGYGGHRAGSQARRGGHQGRRKRSREDSAAGQQGRREIRACACKQDNIVKVSR